MPIYDKLMDKTIVDILFEKSEIITDCALGYNQLLKKLNEKYKEIKGSQYKKISRDKYNFHIKKLVEEETLERSETKKKDRSVNYCLTSKAKKEKILKLLEFKSPKEKQNYLIYNDEIKRTRLFFLLFFVFTEKKIIDLYNDEELRLFLLDNGLAIENLKVIKIFNFWSQNDRVTSYENIGEIRIYKHEKIIKDGKKFRFEFTHYNSPLPGFTLDELSNISQSRNFRYTKDEIKEAFDTLRNNRYIYKICVYRKDTRYGIKDPRLFRLNIDLSLMENRIMDKMGLIWIYKRSITKDERKWLVFFKGINEYEKDMNNLKKSKIQYKKMKSNGEIQKQVTKEIIKLDKWITRDFRGLKRVFLQEIEKYNFPYEKFIDVLYPKIVHGSISLFVNQDI
jgi:hypothetical protein